MAVKRQMVLYTLSIGVASGSLVPSTSEDKPPTPLPAVATPSEPIAYDPHDYDEVPEDEMGRRTGQDNGHPSVSAILGIQWNPSNPDTIRPEESVLIREVSLFQGLN